MTLSEFVWYHHQVARTMGLHTEWRAGQTYFNVLYMHFPDLANEIRGGDLDPFHVSDRIPLFLEWLLDQLEPTTEEVSP